jgi:hypothetical protein
MLSVRENYSPDQVTFSGAEPSHPTTTAPSGKSNKHILCHGIKGKLDSNKAIFISMIPYEGESGKRVIGNKPVSTKHLSVSLLIPVAPGDFLSIFSGKLQYLDSKLLRAIQGPIPSL